MLESLALSSTARIASPEACRALAPSCSSVNASLAVRDLAMPWRDRGVGNLNAHVAGTIEGVGCLSSPKHRMESGKHRRLGGALSGRRQREVEFLTLCFDRHSASRKLDSRASGDA